MSWEDVQLLQVKQTDDASSHLLYFGMLGVPSHASPQPPITFQLLSSATSGRSLLAWWQHPQVELGTTLPFITSPWSISKQEESHYIHKPNSSPDWMKLVLSLGIHPTLKHLGFFHCVHPRKAGVRLEWCLARSPTWPPQGPGCTQGAGAKISSKNTFCPLPCTSCLLGLRSSLWPCGFWGLLQDTHKNFRAMRQHQKYKDFGVIAAHANSWSRLETDW